MDSDPEKQRFLEEFGQAYGYPNATKSIDEIRATEFKRLKDVVYLDHAGATLYSEAQMEDVLKDLNSTLYGNPHSQSNCSMTTSDIVGEARRQILSFFNASPREYKCIFTSGATAALKLVGETFPWSSRSTFMYTVENHNSVLGIREYALREGSAAIAVDIQNVPDLDARCSGKPAIKIMPRTVQSRGETECREKDQNSDTYNLFAFPSECNFSGQKFNPDLVNFVKDGRYEIPETSICHSGQWMVLIDAAKGSATSPPDLSKYKADFVVVSFYKIFGYPTGIGALIARNESAKLLKKTYFSGGTVAASIADIDFYKRRDHIEEHFEDGTLPFASIASLKHGFKILNTLTMSAISRHTMLLASYVRNELVNLRHINGGYVCTLYGGDPELLHNEMGSVVSFNLRRPDGSWFGHREVEKLASLSNIHLRTGCFCNPGACAKHLGLSHSDLLSNIEAGHICWDDRDILNGKPTGGVRVSFGYMSTFEDARTFLRFIKSSFVSMAPQPTCLDLCPAKSFHSATEGVQRVTAGCVLKSITVYPIKSCAGFTVDSWPLSSTGLLHDREWLLLSVNGDMLTQKKVPDMALISAMANLKLGLLIIESPHCKENLQIELKSGQSYAGKEMLEIYSQRYEIQSYTSEVNNWFSTAVGQPCTLVRSYAFQNPIFSSRNGSKGTRREGETRLNFVNEAQILLISEESVADLNNRLKSKFHNGFNHLATDVNPSRFRPNLVVSCGKAYEEDGWKSMTLGRTKFVSLGGCNRCQMINMTPGDGMVQKSNEPLATLASYRRSKGKIYFGILLKLCDGVEPDTWLSVGQELVEKTD